MHTKCSMIVKRKAYCRLTKSECCLFLSSVMKAEIAFQKTVEQLQYSRIPNRIPIFIHFLIRIFAFQLLPDLCKNLKKQMQLVFVQT